MENLEIIAEVYFTDNETTKILHLSSDNKLYVPLNVLALLRPYDSEGERKLYSENQDKVRFILENGDVSYCDGLTFRGRKHEQEE